MSQQTAPKRFCLPSFHSIITPYAAAVAVVAFSSVCCCFLSAERLPRRCRTSQATVRTTLCSSVLLKRHGKLCSDGAMKESLWSAFKHARPPLANWSRTFKEASSTCTWPRPTCCAIRQGQSNPTIASSGACEIFTTDLERKWSLWSGVWFIRTWCSFINGTGIMLHSKWRWTRQLDCRSTTACKQPFSQKQRANKQREEICWFKKTRSNYNKSNKRKHQKKNPSRPVYVFACAGILVHIGSWDLCIFWHANDKDWALQIIFLLSRIRRSNIIHYRTYHIIARES